MDSVGTAAVGGTTRATCALERPWPVVIWMAILTWSITLFVQARANFLDFKYQRYDLGNMVQAVWSTTQGRLLETTFGTGEQTSRLAAHVDPILALLAPLWMIAPTPLSLVAVQIAACALGALPVFWLGCRHLASERAAACLALAYLINPWLAWTALDAMHPSTLAIPLFLFCIWFLDSNRLVMFSVCAILAASTTELAGVSIAGLGLWYWASKNRRTGLVIAFAGLAWTATCLKLIIPAFLGDESQFYSFYTSVGGSPMGVIVKAVTDPGAITDALFTRGDLAYVVALSAPLAGAFLLSPLLAAVAIPALAANSLSSIGGHIDPRGHWIAGILPFLVAATVLGLAKLPRRHIAISATFVMALSIGLFVVFGPPVGAPWLQSFWPNMKPDAGYVTALHDAVELIPDNASVAATTKAGSHLSARRYFYSVPVTVSAEWVLIDKRDPWIPFPATGTERTMVGRFDPKLVSAQLARLGQSSNWRQVFERDGVFVFRRARARAKTVSGSRPPDSTARPTARYGQGAIRPRRRRAGSPRSRSSWLPARTPLRRRAP